MKQKLFNMNIPKTSKELLISGVTEHFTLLQLARIKHRNLLAGVGFIKFILTLRGANGSVDRFYLYLTYGQSIISKGFQISISQID